MQSNPEQARGSRLAAVLRQRCPRCHRGPVFRRLLAMNRTCPVCGLRFGREEGYFTGAMYVSYVIALVSVAPVWLALLATGQPVWLVVGAPALQLAVTTPLIFRYSRVIWMHLDRGFDPEP